MPDQTAHSAPADLRALRRRCLARLRTLPLPVPFDLQAFCAALAAERGRPLLLVPFAGTRPKYWTLRSEDGSDSAASTGAWQASAIADYIFYEQETSPFHQEHIILHELSHLLCGHPPRVEAAATLHAAQLPHIRLDQVEGALHRGLYSTAEEREAEMFASLLLERSASSRTDRSIGSIEGTPAVLQRLGAVLEAEERPSA